MKRLLMIAGCGLVLVMAWGAWQTLADHAAASDPPARTYYESLMLDTPEHAVQTFAEAFQHEDFWTAFLALSPHAQFTFQQTINLLRYNDLLRIEDPDAWHDTIMPAWRAANIVPFAPLDAYEHFETGYVFDSMMLAAKQNDMLLIDLSGGLSITGSQERVGDEGEPVVEVIASVEGFEDPVTFRVVQAPSGRWRVDQVRLAGVAADSTLIWGVER